PGAVHLLGERLDVARLLGAFDACVHPATREAQGVAVLEAMAAGLPTIASAVDGLRELVLDGSTGWLAPPGDAEALAARMELVMANPRAARATAARGAALVRQ